MTWVKLDDQLHAHPKVMRVGLAGTGLFARALSYCGCYATDGVVPPGWAHAQLAPEDHGNLPEQLVAAGLWEPMPDGGFRIPDFCELNPSADEVRVRAQERSEAGRRAAAARWSKKP